MGYQTDIDKTQSEGEKQGTKDKPCNQKRNTEDFIEEHRADTHYEDPIACGVILTNGKFHVSDAGGLARKCQQQHGKRLPDDVRAMQEKNGGNS